MNDAELLHYMGTDAAKWAAEYVKTHGGDEEMLRIWFANAIMHAIDTTRGMPINGDHAEWLREHRP